MLSKKCQYALHALVSLTKAEGKSMTTAGLVRERNLPRKFLESILCELKLAGIVKSRKGKHGGYSLARDPGDIFIKEVVEAVEGNLWLKCRHAENGQSCKSCKSVDMCIVNLVGHSIRSHASAWLATHSIIDIVVQEESITHPLVERQRA